MLSELSQIFLTFLQKNMTVAVVIFADLLARLLLRRMPKKYSYVLWSLVGIRMVFDLPIASRLSVFNLFRSFAGRASTAEPLLLPAQWEQPEPLLPMRFPGMQPQVLRRIPLAQPRWSLEFLDGSG